VIKVNKVNNKLLELEQEFLKVQNDLSSRIELENNFIIEEIKNIAGVDLAYWNIGEKTFGTCCIVIIDYYSKEVIEKVYSYGQVVVPYIPGFLAFRELPLILEAVKKLTVEPDLYMFDGNGYLHFRNMGIATHAAMYLKKPTIGVAKSYLKIGNVDFMMPDNKVGSYTDILVDGEVYGRTLRTSKNVKPIFISCGNWIDLDTCTNITMDCINKESRLPIPVRLADLETHKMREKLAK